MGSLATAAVRRDVGTTVGATATGLGDATVGIDRIADATGETEL